ncbi:MFS transporter [Nocardiopsis sp. SBT366]|uniref:MFS transporter n=1 Tax=Nocardiopsis sp. SBT366 TaxID=1580529 RepID=UPI00066ACB8E|nr:MFS transporter [Nocardiopsis sp. SBT366]
MPDPTDTRRSTPPPHRSVLVILAAISVLPVTVHLPALPEIAAAYGTSFALVNLSIAGYAVATVTAEAVAGALSDRYGRRPVVLVSVTVFTLASLGCALAPTIGIFLACRMSQAAIAACFSVAMVAIRETSDGGDAVRRIGFAGMGWALAPMLGTILGGTLDDLFGWRSIFFALAVIGGLVLLVSMRYMKESSTRSNGPGHDFLPALRRILASPRFWTYSLCMACSMGTLYVFLGGAPLAMDRHLDGSGVALGLYMAMVPGGFVLGSYLAGTLGTRMLRTRLLVLARTLTCSALLAGLVIAVTWDVHPLVLFASCAFVGVGNGLTTPVVNTAVMSEHEDLAGTALGLTAAISIGGGALASSLAGPALGDIDSTSGLLLLLLAPATLALVAAILAAVVDRPIARE